MNVYVTLISSYALLQTILLQYTAYLELLAEMALGVLQIFIKCQFSKPDYFLKICEISKATLPIIPCMQYIVYSTV